MNDIFSELRQLMVQHVYRYSEKPFQLASGKMSNHYFNCKEITLHPYRLELLCRYISEVHIPKNITTPFQCSGGLTLGADPLSYGLALAFQKSGKTVFPLIVRKEAKDHGTGKQIEGQFQKGDVCLVLDDVITTGGSTIKAVEALRKEGILVTEGVCILDREEGGYQALRDQGVQMHPLFSKKDFL